MDESHNSSNGLVFANLQTMSSSVHGHGGQHPPFDVSVSLVDSQGRSQLDVSQMVCFCRFSDADEKK